MAVERVAGCLWNRWPDHRGMGGRMVMESVAGWARNTQHKGAIWATNRKEGGLTVGLRLPTSGAQSLTTTPSSAAKTA